MEPRADEGSVVVFHVQPRNTLEEKCKEAYELRRDRSPTTRINIDV
jgi:hypothetical protein